MAKDLNNQTRWWGKAGNGIKRNWIALACGLGPILVIVIIFSLPIKTVDTQTTEQYWDVEMKSEPYTASESYTDTEPYVETDTRTETIYDSYVYESWSQAFKVAKDSTVTVNFYGVPYYYQPYSIHCPDDDISSCRIWPSYNAYPGAGRAIIQVTYPESITKYRTVTKYREVTKYRDVPTQVLKERTITNQVRMSIWAYLLR